MVCHSLLQWAVFCQTSPSWPIRLGWPHTARLRFIELDKAVVQVIRLTSFLWLWFHCVCPLMPFLSAYCLTWVSLTLDVVYLFTAAPKSTASAPYLGWVAPPDLKCRVALLGHCPWPQTWSSSSWPLLCHYVYYCRQESLRRNGVAIMVNKRVWNAVLGCNLKNDWMISVHFQGKPFNIMVIQVYAPTSNAEETEV